MSQAWLTDRRTTAEQVLDGAASSADRCAVFDDGALRITWSASVAPILLAGEVDEGNCPAMTAALEQLAEGSSEVHLDLAGLAFCDLAGLRALIRLTAGRSSANGGGLDGGRRVVLHQVPRQLTLLLEIVGWDQAPGLSIAGASAR